MKIIQLCAIAAKAAAVAATASTPSVFTTVMTVSESGTASLETIIVASPTVTFTSNQLHTTSSPAGSSTPPYVPATTAIPSVTKHAAITHTLNRGELHAIVAPIRTEIRNASFTGNITKAGVVAVVSPFLAPAWVLDSPPGPEGDDAECELEMMVGHVELHDDRVPTKGAPVETRQTATYIYSPVTNAPQETVCAGGKCEKVNWVAISPRKSGCKSYKRKFTTSMQPKEVVHLTAYTTPFTRDIHGIGGSTTLFQVLTENMATKTQAHPETFVTMTKAPHGRRVTVT